MVREGPRDREHCGLACEQQSPVLNGNEDWLRGIVRDLEAGGFERVRRLCRK